MFEKIWKDRAKLVEKNLSAELDKTNVIDEKLFD